MKKLKYLLYYIHTELQIETPEIAIQILQRTSLIKKIKLLNQKVLDIENNIDVYFEENDNNKELDNYILSLKDDYEKKKLDIMEVLDI